MNAKDPALDQINAVIKRLEALETPARIMDVQIAVAVGYQKKTDATKTAGQWFDPVGQRISGPPYFTSSLQSAYDLMALVSPSNITAVTWDEKGKAMARTEAFVVIAATPAIALCLLALRTKIASNPTDF